MDGITGKQNAPVSEEEKREFIRKTLEKVDKALAANVILRSDPGIIDIPGPSDLEEEGPDNA